MRRRPWRATRARTNLLQASIERVEKVGDGALP
jgi:hypothetical protein